MCCISFSFLFGGKNSRAFCRCCFWWTNGCGFTQRQMAVKRSLKPDIYAFHSTFEENLKHTKSGSHFTFLWIQHPSDSYGFPVLFHVHLAYLAIVSKTFTPIYQSLFALFVKLSSLFDPRYYFVVILGNICSVSSFSIVSSLSMQQIKVNVRAATF